MKNSNFRKSFWGLLFIFAFASLCLTGCGKRNEGTYVSAVDSKRKVTFRENDNTGLFTGTFTIKNAGETIEGYYTESEYPFNMLILYDYNLSNIEHYSGFMIISNDELLLVPGDGTSEGEKFNKTNFLKTMWRDHRTTCIVIIAVIGIIGFIQNRKDEKNDITNEK